MNFRSFALIFIALTACFGSVASMDTSRAEKGRPYRAYLVSTARDGTGPPMPLPVGATLPPLPARWPTNLELGESDSPGGATAASAKGLGFRYQYLAGGVNTGTGWVTWSPDGSFVRDYAAESRATDIIPVFSYYMVRQSLPGAAMGEAAGVRANLADPATMRDLFVDLQLVFQRTAESGVPLSVLHFEPDLWGFIQQGSNNDDASSFPISVASSGNPSLQGLPNTAAGLAQALVRLRDVHAPAMLLAYHNSAWGTGNDPLYSDPDSAEIADLARRSVAFYGSLGATFDLAFGEMGDRDSGFKQHIYGDGGASWWDPGDFERNVAYIRAFAEGSGLRLVLWQIPLGNTQMRSMNNVWNHFQDNKVEWLLGQGAAARLDAYIRAGVVALLFGRGADGATCACDAAGDGVTNPLPINGNNSGSLSADDDGGFFADRRNAFAVGPVRPLP